MPFRYIGGLTREQAQLLDAYINLLRLSTVTITQAGWTTDPTNLGNIRDRDVATACGEAADSAPPGIETNGDCEIKVDLGANYFIDHIYAKVGIRCLVAAGSVVNCRMRAGPAGNLTDTLLMAACQHNTAVEEINYLDYLAPGTAAFGTTNVNQVRYITTRIYQDTPPNDIYLKIYEILVLGYREMTI